MCKVHAKEFQEELERDKLEEYMLDARREWEERFGTDEELGLTN